MTDAAVSLFVEVQAAGRHSLIEQTPGERNERYLPGDLFENPDEVSFYRAVAKWIADWAGKGVRVEYADVDSPRKH